jgi:hypothetical protein
VRFADPAIVQPVEMRMAKGQKKSNREVRKPKQAKTASASSSSGTVGGLEKPKGTTRPGGK